MRCQVKFTMCTHTSYYIFILTSLIHFNEMIKHFCLLSIHEDAQIVNKDRTAVVGLAYLEEEGNIWKS